MLSPSGPLRCKQPPSVFCAAILGCERIRFQDVPPVFALGRGYNAGVVTGYVSEPTEKTSTRKNE